MKYKCPKCGFIIEEGTNFCPDCGQKFTWPTPAPVEQPPVTPEPIVEEQSIESNPTKDKKGIPKIAIIIAAAVLALILIIALIVIFAGGSKIEGVWKGDLITYTFAKDGTFSQTALNTKTIGTYKIEDNKIILTDGAVELINYFTVDKDTLSVSTEENGVALVYNKVDKAPKSAYVLDEKTKELSGTWGNGVGYSFNSDGSVIVTKINGAQDEGTYTINDGILKMSFNDNSYKFELTDNELILYKVSSSGSIAAGTIYPFSNESGSVNQTENKSKSDSTTAKVESEPVTEAPKGLDGDTAVTYLGKTVKETTDALGNYTTESVPDAPAPILHFQGAPFDFIYSPPGGGQGDIAPMDTDIISDIWADEGTFIFGVSIGDSLSTVKSKLSGVNYSEGITPVGCEITGELKTGGFFGIYLENDKVYSMQTCIAY